MKSALAIFIFIFSINLYSQQYFTDDFSSNPNNWWVGEDENFSSEIDDGKMVLNFEGENVFKVLWKPIPIYYEKDFLIKADFKQLSGVDNHGYGLVWASSNTSNMYYFIISSNQNFCIYENNNGKWNPLKKWTSSNLINEMEQMNKMEINQKNKKLSFLINGVSVLDTTCFEAYGSYTGFILNNTMEVEIDNLEIKYDTAKINIVENPVLNTDKTNLGEGVNSKYSDVTPRITYDGKTLYFCRKNDPENLGNEDRDDIFMSVRTSSGTWGKAERLPAPLNNDGHNSIVSVSSDGNKVLLMNQYTEDGTALKGGGISSSIRTADNWSIPKDVELEDFYNHHKNNYTNYLLSADSKILVMAVQRRDSYGDMDIYVSFLEGDKYSVPLNLGPVINTASMDYAPYLAADGKTLYFASSGHPGYGGDDIFMSKRLDETWTNWSEPKNLGNGINTSAGEAYFVLPASGEYAYMTTTENSFGASDIISIKLTEGSKPEPVVLVYGKVLNSVNSNPIGTNIQYNSLETGIELGIANSNPKTGDYKIVLPYGKLYSFLAEKEGFYSISENIDLTKNSSYMEIEKNLYLTPIAKGNVFRLNNVFFDYDKSTLREESFLELNRLVQFMNDNKNIQIEISGHTDNQGGDDYNMRLSSERAKSVLEYLTKNGISGKMLISKGYGKTKPVASNDMEEGRQQNRRVEVKILNDN